MRVSGTPQRPKPPARRVLLDLMSARAAEAEERTLLIAWMRVVEEKERVRRRIWERDVSCVLSREWVQGMPWMTEREPAGIGSPI